MLNYSFRVLGDEMILAQELAAILALLKYKNSFILTKIEIQEHIHTFFSNGTQCVLVTETVIPALDIFQRQQTFNGSKHFFPGHTRHFTHLR